MRPNCAHDDPDHDPEVTVDRTDTEQLTNDHDPDVTVDRTDTEQLTNDHDPDVTVDAQAIDDRDRKPHPSGNTTDHSVPLIGRSVTADATPAQPRSNGSPEGLSRLAQITGKIVVPVTVITALLVYFGWARTSAIYQTFGIPYSILGFSAQDYVLDSVYDTFEPAARILLLILVAIPAHVGLIRVTRELRWRTRAVLSLVAAGMALAVVGLLGFLGMVTYQVAWPLIPMSLGLGVGLIGYAISLRRMAGEAQFRPLGDSDVIDIVARVTFAAFLTLTLFWSVAIYAQLHGLKDGQEIAQQPASLPGVVVFSPHPLFLHGGGIRETVLIGDQESRYYRYDGLRLLVRAGGRYILLPENWRPGMRAVILPDSPAVRLEIF